MITTHQVGSGHSAAETRSLYRALAATCIQTQIRRVLIVAVEDDGTGERALRDAACTMLLAGLAEGFKLALVAASPRVKQAYGNTCRDLNLAGVVTRLFEKREDAQRWLDVR